MTSVHTAPPFWKQFSRMLVLATFSPGEPGISPWAVTVMTSA